eukprot:TRINITY_DN1385_c0_g1_i5.p1 TRINITY_DN1385_c0_g1~~TRINITY_DN1385_c0_g1_i5.p1  ORF type:complete len:678 (-),score=109.72 TRINITY_DN1385_c0_g1_i5:1269-3302(-)
MMELEIFEKLEQTFNTRPRPVSPTVAPLALTAAEEAVPVNRFCTDRAEAELSVLGHSFEKECRAFLERNPVPILPPLTSNDLAPWVDPGISEPAPTRNKSDTPVKTIAEPAVPQSTPPKPVKTPEQLAPDAPGVRYSILSTAEHTEFLQLHQQFCHDSNAQDEPAQLTPESHKRYFEMKALVCQEQIEWKQAIHDYEASRSQQYAYCTPTIRSLVEDVIAQRRARVKDYPRLYTVHSSFPCAATAGPDLRLQWVATPLQFGQVLRMFPAPVNATLPHFKFRRSADEPPGADRWNKAPLPVTGNDPYIGPICEAHNIDMAMTSSVFVALMDMHAAYGYSEAWELPVTVRKCGDRLCAFVDKPLVKPKYTMREKNNIFFKHAFESACLQTTKAAMPARLVNPQGTPNVTPQGVPIAPTVLMDHGLMYTVWALDNVRLLIRCKIHGYVPDSSVRAQLRYIGFQTKLEYQLMRGWEDFTPSEQARWWAFTYLRPDAHLMLGRINPMDSQLMRVETMDLPKILPADSQYKAMDQVAMLANVAKQLKELPEGQYMLVHRPRQPQIQIYRATTGIGPYDLHTQHNSSGATDVDTIPCVTTRWSSSNANQIPFTFAPRAPPPPKREPREPRERDPMMSSAGSAGSNKRERYPVVGGVRYCHAFARTGSCRNGDERKPVISVRFHI